MLTKNNVHWRFAVERCRWAPIPHKASVADGKRPEVIMYASTEKECARHVKGCRPVSLSHTVALVRVRRRVRAGDTERSKVLFKLDTHEDLFAVRVKHRAVLELDRGGQERPREQRFFQCVDDVILVTNWDDGCQACVVVNEGDCPLEAVVACDQCSLDVTMNQGAWVGLPCFGKGRNAVPPLLSHGAVFTEGEWRVI